MRRGVKIIALTLTHVLVLTVGAASFAGCRVRRAFEAASRDPLHRIGRTMTLQSGSHAASSLDDDLRALSATVPAPTPDIIRLAVLLEQGRLDEAGAACAALGWRRCDPQSLVEMREAIGP